MSPKRISQTAEVVERRVRTAVLYAAEIGRVEIGPLGQFLLGPAASLPEDPDSFAEPSVASDLIHVADVAAVGAARTIAVSASFADTQM